MDLPGHSDQWTSERFDLEVTEFVEKVTFEAISEPDPPEDPVPPKGPGPPRDGTVESLTALTSFGECK